MEAIGASASILTFLTVAVSISNTLSAIKDGPEIIGFLNDEIFQLKTILERLRQVAPSIAGSADRLELRQLVERCKDQLVDFEAKLRQLDVSGADGRRGRLWRKLKICLADKELDQIRHVVRGHLHRLKFHLVIVQARQQTLSTETVQEMILTDILPPLQQIQQDMAAIKVSQASVTMMQVDSSGMSKRVMELDDTQSHTSHQAALDDAIARLMKLLERRPCVVEFDDSKEIIEDLERLLQFVQDEVFSDKRGGGDGEKGEDVSSEVKLFTHLVLSAPTLGINQNERRGSLEATDSRIAVFQERKRKELHTNDAVITVATTKRREKLLSISKDAPLNELYGRGFRGSLTLKNKTKKKMVTLSVQQSQLLFDRFTSLLPRVIVCSILPNDSPVFKAASNGSVEDLMRLIIGNKASLHDHDEDGWSLLHHAVGNLPTFRFLIEEGLDVTEIADDKSTWFEGQTDPLTIAHENGHDTKSLEILLHAGADPTIKLEGHPILVNYMTGVGDIKARNFLHKALSVSPFVFPGTPAESGNLIPSFCHTWTSIPGEEFIPEQERKTLDLFISHGYEFQRDHGNHSLHMFFASRRRSFSKVLERRDLVAYLISRGADPCSLDYDGASPSYRANGSMCMPCSISQSSLMGDLWDSVLDILGCDIATFRQHYPRIASYKNGYTRETFEQLWSGREDRCPYWNDEPWPKFLDQEAQLDFESELGRGLCRWCEPCFRKRGSCNRCGVCLLVFRYSCDENLDPDHEHDDDCPRSRVGYLERYGNCDHLYFRAKVDSEPDSDDEMSYYSDSSSFGDDSGSEISQSHERETECCNRGFEEISSDDDSVGGAEL